jgi:putative flippase GtrA
MIKKTVLYFWSARHQFARYFIIGSCAVILDVGTLYLLKEYLHLRPVVAVIINGAVLINFIFFLNKHWTFKSGGATHKQIVRFFILAGFNYLVSVGWMFIFNEKIGFNYLATRVFNIALSVAWNFLLYKYWVYKHETDYRLQTTSSGHTQPKIEG